MPPLLRLLGIFGFVILVGFTARPALGKSLLGVASQSPWTLRELEERSVELVSYDPQTGLAYVVASAEEENRLRDAGFVVTTVESDLESRLRKLQSLPDLGAYHTYDETVAELQALASTFPEMSQLLVLGESLEGRPILALKISDTPELDEADEPDVLVVGCHHAREFMSVEVPLHLARTLLEGSEHSPELHRLVTTRELWVVPMLNPDGHVYQAESQGRPGWRKNRRPNWDATFGVDLNRNYGYRWAHDDIGSSTQTLSETYRGPQAFSEPETQVLRRLAERQRFVIALTYHSFGNLLLYPWGFTRNETTPDQIAYAALADSMVRENGYTPGNAHAGTIYLANGTLDDYLYGEWTPRKPQRTLCFTPELNSMREGGFWPADSLVAPTCEAMLPMNLFVLRVADNVRAPLGPPPPLLVAEQDPQDRRRIRLDWTQGKDPDNPVEHYQVFEIDFLGGGPASRTQTVRLERAERVLLERDLPWPQSESVVVRLEADLEGLWDYVYVEARSGSGAWTALRGSRTRHRSPTMRNAGHGITGSIAKRSDRFRLEGVGPGRFDLALRLDPHPESPRQVFASARLDVAGTYSEERRILDPNVQATHYEVLAERSGLFAYGVTAVDVHGDKTDSELYSFVIPTVRVEIANTRLVRLGSSLQIHWERASDHPARFEAWMRPHPAGDLLGDPSVEWGRTDYRLVAKADDVRAGPGSLTWPTQAGSFAVLLRGIDADGARLFGPWSLATERSTRLAGAFPNPARPGARIAFELARSGWVRLDLLSVEGRTVRQLASGVRHAGRHAVRFDGRDDQGRRLASGIYIVRLRQGRSTQSRRLVFLD